MLVKGVQENCVESLLTCELMWCHSICHHSLRQCFIPDSLSSHQLIWVFVIQTSEENPNGKQNQKKFQIFYWIVEALLTIKIGISLSKRHWVKIFDSTITISWYNTNGGGCGGETTGKWVNMHVLIYIRSIFVIINSDSESSPLWK